MTKLSGTVVEGSLVTDTKKPEPPGLMLFVAKTWFSPTTLGTVLLAIPTEYVTFTTEPPATTAAAAGLCDITYPNPTVDQTGINVPGVRPAAMMSVKSVEYKVRVVTRSGTVYFAVSRRLVDLQRSRPLHTLRAEEFVRKRRPPARSIPETALWYHCETRSVMALEAADCVRP